MLGLPAADALDEELDELELELELAEAMPACPPGLPGCPLDACPADPPPGCATNLPGS